MLEINAPRPYWPGPRPALAMKASPLLWIGLCWSCGGWLTASVVTPAKEVPSTQTTTAPATTPNPSAKTYLLHPSDVITVDVVDDAHASHEYKLGVDGSVRPVYLATPVILTGMSTSSAEDALAAAYVKEGIFTHPQISVSVKEYSPQQIFFLGQVNHPGTVTIPPEQGLSLVAAFSQAGGHTSKASRYCTITRLLPDGKSLTITMDLRGAVEDAKKDIMLQNGDTVFMGESVLGADWQ